MPEVYQAQVYYMMKLSEIKPRKLDDQVDDAGAWMVKQATTSRASDNEDNGRKMG
jgi:hypothetical protein